jgi:glycosyltransferase involved in cell wall biosynthesis
VYASADMFLFASRTDTFGQAILEAAASGVPVVALAWARRPSRPPARVAGTEP